jgi:hypothetical protein
MTEKPQPKLIFTTEFLVLLGRFHGAWCTADASIDLAIGKFLKLTPEQTHLMTAGVMSGPKCRLLADLIRRSDHQNKSKLLDALNKIRGEVKRDVLAHAYIRSSSTQVTFISRKTGSRYEARDYSFTLTEFAKHVKVLTQAAEDFDKALATTEAEFSEFIKAAMTTNSTLRSP